MRFYLATAHLDEARQAKTLGFVHGVFVPRMEVAHFGQDYADLLQECAGFSYAWLGAQAESLDAGALVQEAKRLSGTLGSSLALIMPMTLESVKACADFTGHGGDSILQWVATPVQALVAARAGARGIMLDAELLGGVGVAVDPLVSEIKSLYKAAGLTTEVLVEGVRDAAEASRMAIANADGIVCTWDVLQNLAYHPFSDQGMERLLAEWSIQTF